jgi:hypothetical protein
MVLGLNDALVELTGALAGFTLAFRNTRLIAMAGFITGIAASLSMATSEYLSTKSEESSRDPFKASAYTGSAYVITVLFLIFPYVIFTNYYFCLGFTLFNAMIVILNIHFLCLRCQRHAILEEVFRDGDHQFWNSSLNIFHKFFCKDVFKDRPINLGHFS